MLWRRTEENRWESFKEGRMFKVGFLGVVSRLRVPEASFAITCEAFLNIAGNTVPL